MSTCAQRSRKLGWKAETNKLSSLVAPFKRQNPQLHRYTTAADQPPASLQNTHQLLGSPVLERGRGDLVLLREEMVVVRLLQV